MQINVGGNNNRASPTGDAQQDRRRAAKSGQRLLYQERIRLKKLAQRKRRLEREKMRKVMVVVTLNAGTMTGRGREVVDVMERKKIDILCVQETRWKGQKARETGNRYKLYCVGEASGRNGVGIVLSPAMKEGVLKVNRVSSRLIWMIGCQERSCGIAYGLRKWK